jgi:hypothetical protein
VSRTPAAWANTTNFPPKTDHVTNKPIDAGFDPISMFELIKPTKIYAYSLTLVGQNGNNTRVTAGSNPSDPSATLTLPIDFVKSCGGGYFFTPSLTALKTVLTA